MFFQKGDSVRFTDTQIKYHVLVCDEEHACLHNPRVDSTLNIRLFINYFSPIDSYKTVKSIKDEQGRLVYDRTKKPVYSRIEVNPHESG